MKHLNSTCIVAIFAFVGGLFANTIFFSQVHASNIVLFEDGFTPIQEEAQSLFVISESGFEDIQDVSEGKEPTPTLTPTLTPVIGTSTSSRGGGGSNPIVVQRLSHDIEEKNEETHSSPLEETLTDFDINDNINNHDISEMYQDNNQDSNQESNEESAATDRENKNIYTIDIFEKYHEAHAGKYENNGIKNLEENILSISSPESVDTVIHNSSDIVFGNYEPESKDHIPIHTLENVNGEFVKEMNLAEMKESKGNVFCGSNGFHYIFLLILFLCGMITEYILIKIFYNKQNDK